MYIPKEWYIALSAPLVANPMNPVDQTTLKDRVNDLDKLSLCPEAGLGVFHSCAAYDPRPGECVSLERPLHIEAVIVAPDGVPRPGSKRGGPEPIACKLYRRNAGGCNDNTHPKLIDWILDENIGEQWYDDIGYYQCDWRR